MKKLTRFTLEEKDRIIVDVNVSKEKLRKIAKAYKIEDKIHYFYPVSDHLCLTLKIKHVPFTFYFHSGKNYPVDGEGDATK